MQFIKLLCLTAIALSTMVTATFSQEISRTRTYPTFDVGVTGIRASITPGMIVTVQEIVPNSPAMGKLRKGDVIDSAAGRELNVADPRVPLGRAVGQAEVTGKLVLSIRRAGHKKQVTLDLPKLGAYSKSWPIDCPKSAAIIKATAEFIAKSQNSEGAYALERKAERDALSGSLAGLFLLSTGDSKYLPHVRLHAHKLAAAVESRPTHSSWHLGYQGILLAEYYLKTGDKKVLAGLKSLCDRAIATQAAGAWGHGGAVSPGYVQSGLMNSAGVPVLTTLILARECGVDVDEEGFHTALKFFYRMVGHGSVCYGDHRSELWWPSTNGRNGMLACGLSLLEEPRYQKAAQHLAMLVVDSYYKPEFGHTGGGFNVIWRGMSSVHVPKNRQSHRRRQFKELTWYYDLCRQSGGGFSMLPTPPNTMRYTGLTWGTGAVGLTYTAPLKTLRITGAPRSKHSVKYVTPKLDWGTDADLVFLGTDDAIGFGKETTAPHEVYEKLLGKGKSSVSVEFCAKHLRHYSPLVRSWAARVLNEKNTAQSKAALAQAVAHADPRVRRAAYDGISGYNNWGRPIRGRMSRADVSGTFLSAIVKTLSDKTAAWWEIDGALFALGHAEPVDIRKHNGFIKKYSEHEEWYLREAAFWALDGLRESMSAEEFKKLAGLYANESSVFARSSFDSGFRVVLKQSKIKLDKQAMAAIAEVLGATLHTAKIPKGYGEAGSHEVAHRTMMILKHFDPSIYQYITDDLAKYLDAWTPYHQHSVWLISGSRWQPGLLKVLSGLDKKHGTPIYLRLKKILTKWDDFDRRRYGGAAAEIPAKLRAAIEAWEKKHGV